MTEFLHGIETFSLKAGPRPTKQVKSGVIGLVGTAPIHHATGPAAPNALSLFLGDRNLPEYGPKELAAYTIPKALNAIVAQGAGLAYVVNVFDPTVHKTTVASASKNITNKKVTLTDKDIITATVVTAADGACVEGTDYTIDRVNGIITVISGGALAPGGVFAATCKVGYDKANPAATGLTDGSLIIGGVSGGGVRTGMQAWLNGANLFGAGPKLLIAPGFSTLPTVRAALVTIAQKTKLRAHAIGGVPTGTTVAQAIAGRGSSSPVDLTAADGRLHYAYPNVKVDATNLEPFDAYLAGAIAANDAENGFWFSVSNRPIRGIVGTELSLTASVTDPNCDVNQLNAAGLVTIYSGFGEPLAAWGNRSSIFPGSGDVDSFMAVQRAIDMTEEMIELTVKPYIDKPITGAMVQQILEDCNAYIRVMISRGAMMPGSRLEFFEEDNPPVELAAGHITLTRTYATPPPAERFSIKSVYDTSLIKVA